MRYVLLALSVVACGRADVPAPAASSSPPQESAAPSASAAPAEPPSAALTTKTLARKQTPRARHDADKASCDAGDRAGCRALAERYTVAGPRASCGVPRNRTAPSLKYTPADAEGDRVAYERAMGRACAAGDADACAILKVAHRVVPMVPRHALWAGVLGDPQSVGIRRFRASEKPRWSKILDDERASCLAAETPAPCEAPKLTLFAKEKPGKDGKLAAEIRARATEACETTHDCPDIYMALDKSGYTPAELAPVREAFAETLASACLEGDCTCGDAARYLPETDPRFVDLAILGCENGEAEGCYALARALEVGAGVSKDEARARALYEVACPPLRPTFWQGGPTTDYSPRACDRLAEIAIGGAYPGNDRHTAKHYAISACRFPSYEIDHGPCVRLGMLWATREGAGNNAHEARMAAFGESFAGGDRPHLDDCTRPSAERECNELREALKKTH